MLRVVRRVPVWIPLSALMILAGGCIPRVHRVILPPEGLATLAQSQPWLKVHLEDGSLLVLETWQLDSLGTWITGTGVRHDPARGVRGYRESGPQAVPLADVVLCETNSISTSPAVRPLLGMSVFTGILGILCWSNPKTCFGSCPTVYAPDGNGRMQLMAESFSSAVAPALEAEDVDMLLHTRTAGSEFRLQLTNEAQETHVIRRMDLLVAPRPLDGRIYPLAEGGFIEGFNSRSPDRVLAAEGDCSGLLAAADGRERFSLADGQDLATRETLELEFDAVPEGDLGLVVTSRQTLMTTYLFYQALAWLGHDAGRWLASLETGGETATDEARALARLLGSIEVFVLDRGGNWVLAGSVGETGPIAVDTELVPLPASAASPLRVRLVQTQGLWRLDHVAVARLGDRVIPQRVVPHAVFRGDSLDTDALARLLDPAASLVSLPGDRRDLVYTLPGETGKLELFLDARGYYLEWMRAEWLAEQDPAKAVRLARDPAGALRDMAPAFKLLEPDMEESFWSSRYAIQP